MNLPFGLTLLDTIPLRHTGDCSLLGVTADGVIYAEEIYGDGWLAQHKIDSKGRIAASADEQDGANISIIPLAVPLDAEKSARVWNTMSLNFTGARHRGLRVVERVDDLVRGVAMNEKMLLVKRLELAVPPPMLIGLAESYVLAEAEVIHPDWFIVCRRLRFAYALLEEAIDNDGLPYDYDTRVLYTAHVFHRADESESTLARVIEGLPGVTLQRPMDCVILGDRLYIAEGGDAEQEHMSMIHVFKLDRPDTPSADDEWRKKIYGF